MLDIYLNSLNMFAKVLLIHLCIRFVEWLAFLIKIYYVLIKIKHE